MNVVQPAELLTLSLRNFNRFISDKRLSAITTSARCVRFSLTTFFHSLNTVTPPAEIISANTLIETRGGLKVPLNGKPQQGWQGYF